MIPSATAMCLNNNRFKVEDTQTGISKPYPNALNNPFPPIQDTNAFATCP